MEKPKLLHRSPWEWAVSNSQGARHVIPKVYPGFTPVPGEAERVQSAPPIRWVNLAATAMITAACLAAGLFVGVQEQRRPEAPPPEMPMEKVAEKTDSTSADETLPDIRQAKRLAVLYGLTLDELIDFDLEVQEIQEAIEHTRDETADKIDWIKMWSKKYPVLAQYQSRVDAAPYAAELERLLEDLKRTCGCGELDAFLVLKDILAGV